jgi:hypothetical protein
VNLPTTCQIPAAGADANVTVMVLSKELNVALTPVPSVDAKLVTALGKMPVTLKVVILYPAIGAKNTGPVNKDIVKTVDVPSAMICIEKSTYETMAIESSFYL